MKKSIERLLAKTQDDRFTHLIEVPEDQTIRSQGNPLKRIGYLLAKALDDGFTHLIEVYEGRIIRSQGKPPKSIECLFAEQMALEIMHLDLFEDDSFYWEIKKLDWRIKALTDNRDLFTEQRDEAEKSVNRESCYAMKRDIEPIFEFLNDEIEFLTDHRDRVVEARDKSRETIHRELSAAAKRAMEKVGENLTWAQCIPNLKPGRQTSTSEFEYLLRDDMIVDEYKRLLTENPGTSGKGLKTRLIHEMVEELIQAGKPRIGDVTIRKILRARGIK